MDAMILSTLLVRHLPHADNIIVLDASGQISEQGSFEHLRAKEGFVSSLIVHPSLLDQGPTRPAEDKSTRKASPASTVLQGPTANDVAERTRRIGDSAVYKYYYAAVGWKWTTVILTLSFAYMIFGNLPGE